MLPLSKEQGVKDPFMIREYDASLGRRETLCHPS